MSMTDPAPRLSAILRTDFLTLAGALVPPISFAIAISGALGILPDRTRSIAEASLVVGAAIPVGDATLLAIGCTVAGLALFAWRIAKIRSVFRARVQVQGRVTGLRPFKDRAWVRYAYAVHGYEHEVRHLVRQSPAYQRLEIGQAVAVAVDPRRPTDGFLTMLFE